MRSRKRRRNGRFGRWSGDRPQHGADAARLLGGSSISLTLLPELTNTTMTYPGSIQDAYTAIMFGPPFLRIKRPPRWTAQRAIGLWGKASPASRPSVLLVPIEEVRRSRDWVRREQAGEEALLEQEQIRSCAWVWDGAGAPILGADSTPID